MINIDDVTKEHIKQYNPNWPQNSDYSYRILITVGSRSSKTNWLINLINEKSDIDQIYLYNNETNI